MNDFTVGETPFGCPECGIPTVRFGDWGPSDPYLECPKCGDRFDVSNDPRQ